MGLVLALVNTVMSTSFQKELRISLRTERPLPFQERFWVRGTLLNTSRNILPLTQVQPPVAMSGLRSSAMLIGSWLPTFRDTT